MTEQPAVYPGYATPTFKLDDDGYWWVSTHLRWQIVGRAYDRRPIGWTAFTPRSHYVGLFPDKQAAGEALVRHAGYEVLR